MALVTNSAKAEVIQGTLDLLVLKVLLVSPMHGWGISSRIAALSGDAFKVGQGSLYPALHRLERRDLITSHYHQTENNRIARYYELTAGGRRALAERIDEWRLYSAAVNRVLDAG